MQSSDFHNLGSVVKCCLVEAWSWLELSGIAREEERKCSKWLNLRVVFSDIGTQLGKFQFWERFDFWTLFYLVNSMNSKRLNLLCGFCVVILQVNICRAY